MIYPGATLLFGLALAGFAVSQGPESAPPQNAEVAGPSASNDLDGRIELDDVQANEFAVPTDRPDRDYFNLGLGFSAVQARGRSFFVFYDTDLGRDDFEAYTLSFGLRLEL